MQRGFLNLVVITLIVVAAGALYWNRSSIQLPEPIQNIIQPASPAPTQVTSETASWKTHTSSAYGYSVQYPSGVELIDCEDDGTCFWVFQLKNKDLLITFGAFGLPKNQSIIDYASLGFCHTDKGNVKQEKVNNILFYQTKEVFSEKNICLNAISTLRYTTDENSDWIVDIQAKAYSQEGVNLFNKILSTFKFLE